MTAPAFDFAPLSDESLRVWAALALSDDLLRPSERAAKALARENIALRAAARALVEADVIDSYCEEDSAVCDFRALVAHVGGGE